MSEINELKKILKNHEERIIKLEKLLTSSSKQKNDSRNAKNKKKQIRPSLASSIESLVKENFFDTPKTFSEIIEQQKANAVFYPKTSYPESLLRLVKKKILRRLKDGNKWTYVKYG